MGVGIPELPSSFTDCYIIALNISLCGSDYPSAEIPNWTFPFLRIFESHFAKKDCQSAHARYWHLILAGIPAISKYVSRNIPIPPTMPIGRSIPTADREGRGSKSRTVFQTEKFSSKSQASIHWPFSNFAAVQWRWTRD